MRIGIDIDDTISDTLNNNLNILRKYKYPQISCREFTVDQFNQFVYVHRKEILETMEPLKNAPEVIQRLFLENEIIVISSRNINGYIPIEETISFFEKYNIPFNELYLNIQDKGEFCEKNKIDLMIDDSEKHLISCNNNGVKCIKFGEYSSKFISFNDWLLLEKFIGEIIYGENNRCKQKSRRHNGRKH